MEPDEYWRQMTYYITDGTRGLWGGALSPEGQLLRQLEAAEAMCSGESDITDELRCHLRRIDKEARA